MDHITIPIREGMDEHWKADLAAWLTDLVKQVTASEPLVNEDTTTDAEAIGRVKQGMAEIAQGRGVDGHTAMRRIAEKNGFSLPR